MRRAAITRIDPVEVRLDIYLCNHDDSVLQRGHNSTLIRIARLGWPKEQIPRMRDGGLSSPWQQEDSAGGGDSDPFS